MINCGLQPRSPPGIPLHLATTTTASTTTGAASEIGYSTAGNSLEKALARPQPDDATDDGAGIGGGGAGEADDDQPSTVEPSKKSKGGATVAAVISCLLLLVIIVFLIFRCRKIGPQGGIDAEWADNQTTEMYSNPAFGKVINEGTGADYLKPVTRNREYEPPMAPPPHSNDTLLDYAEIEGTSGAGANGNGTSVYRLHPARDRGAVSIGGLRTCDKLQHDLQWGTGWGDHLPHSI